MFSQLFSRLFSNTEVDNFARALASELAQRYPVGVEANDGEDGREGGRDEKKARRLERALESIYRKAKDFRQGQRLGVYRKARLGNTFKWQLRELGYRDAFVEEITSGLVLSISRD